MSAEIILFPAAGALTLGREALEMVEWDLCDACEHHPDLRAEIVLAWLHAAVSRQNGEALELIQLAADALEFD